MGSASARKALIIFGIWTLFVVIFTAHSYLYSSTRGEDINWTPVLVWAMSEWYTWAALTPFILWLARRFPIDGPAKIRTVLIHLSAGIIFSILHVLLQNVVMQWGAIAGRHVRPVWELLARGLPAEFHIDFATYAVIIASSHAVEYYRRYRERELRSSQLETALANAQLAALRMQINPHFLFNTLNSISALIEEDAKAAQRMVARLGDFLRLTLTKAGGQTSPLEDEVKFLNSYLEIEQVRFGDRLKVNINVEPDARKALVPTLILQPIVENAFRHALSKVETGFLDIQGRRSGDMLELTVRDNGPGLPAAEAARDEASRNGGVGLWNTRERLQAQFGSNQSLHLQNRPDGGVVVTIRIPFGRKHGTGF